MADKIYCGSAKEINTSFGKIMKVSMSKKDIQLLTENLNEKGYINLNIQERKTPDNYGNTHYVIVDTWKKEVSDDKTPF